MTPLTRRRTLAALVLAGAGGVMWQITRRPRSDRADAIYAEPLEAPKGGQRVFHLGHSLVGQDMPAMLAQLAGTGHAYDSQLGWGTSLKQHWEPSEPIAGFAEANAHPHYRDAREALLSGEYDAVVLTEMVEIRDAIRYHDSPVYLARWADLARQANPRTRIYLYETWHHTDDGNGWLKRIDRDLPKYWQGGVKYPALEETAVPIHLIPAGQAMAAFVRAAQEAGGVGGIKRVQDLFARHADGTPDTIHFNDRGAYLVALTHFAVLYHRDPKGLPHQLMRADGTPADAPSPDAAALMQRVVWDVVRRYPETGVGA